MRGWGDPLARVSALVFVLLACGGAAGPHPWDVGELVAAAVRLGGSHAPGQPLHALLAHATMFVPLGTIALRVAWLSSLGAALAVYGLGRAVRALADRDDSPTRWAAIVAALALALTPAVLRSAMRPEVYTLALACVALGAWALAERARGYPHGLRVTAILAGLAFALHPPHALALAAMALAAIVAKRPRRVELGGSIALGLVVTTASIAYLPIRAAAGAPCWGDPTTASGLWAYVSGAAYQRNLGSRGGDAWDVALYVAGTVPLVALAVLSVRDRALRLAWSLALVALVGALLQPFEERNPDNVAYDAPAIGLALAAAAVTIARSSRPWALALLPAAPLALAVSGGHLGSADLPALETLAFETLGAPAPYALLVTRTDFVAASTMLGQEVDRSRPDVAHFVQGLATSSWHWRSLAHHPAFDGEPHRGPGADPRSAYVLGALARARGRVEIDVEDAGLLGDHGTLRGALLVEGFASVDARAMAERTMPAIASSLGWDRLGDHEIGAQIVRDVVIRRAPLLLSGPEGARARRELGLAAPEVADAVRSLDRVAPRDTPVLVHDPAFALAARGDVVRMVAVLLDRQARPDEATALLQAQQASGDDLALAQLAAIELADGLVGPARATFAAYRARHPDVRSPELDALEAALQ